MLESLLSIRDRLSEIVEKRAELGGGRVHVFERRFDARPVFFEHAAHVAEAGAQIGAIPGVQEIVHARDGLLEFAGAVVEGGDELGDLRAESVELAGDGVKVHVGFRAEERSRGGGAGLRTSRRDFKMIFAEGAEAHDLHHAVRLDGSASLDAEGDFNARGVLGVKAKLFDAAYLRSAGVPDRGAGFEAAGERKVRAVANG